MKKEIVNVTPHSITMLECEELSSGKCDAVGDNDKKCEDCLQGKVFSIPSCGTVISATPVENHYKTTNQGIELVTTSFEPNKKSKKELKKIEEAYWGEVIIVGSIIAAQAFPERVWAMVPVPGYERVPPDKKLVRTDKFTVFLKEN